MLQLLNMENLLKIVSSITLVLIYKYNNHPIKCVIRLDVFEHGFSSNQDLVCEVDIDTWFYIVREKI